MGEAIINDAATKIKESFLSFLIETVFVEPARTRYTKVSTMLKKETEKLQKRFFMKDLDDVHYFLGIQIERDRAKKKMLLHQERYLGDYASLRYR